jgi:hypothetical protein
MLYLRYRMTRAKHPTSLISSSSRFRATRDFETFLSSPDPPGRQINLSQRDRDALEATK